MAYITTITGKTGYGLYHMIEMINNLVSSCAPENRTASGADMCIIIANEIMKNKIAIKSESLLQMFNNSSLSKTQTKFSAW